MSGPPGAVVTLPGAVPAQRPPETGDPTLDASNRLETWIALAGGWAGPERLALILSGSHARGDAVWTRVAGRMLSLSDLDLYAVMPDRAAQRAAGRRAAAARPGLQSRLEDLGLAGSLEVAFLTPEDLARLPARPGTLELKRHGRVVAGDPGWLARVPAWGPRDVSAEEALLLLENRAFELLEARAGLAEPGELARLEARHATLKTALDLAGVECLLRGEYPDEARSRVACARARRAGPEPPWETALAWRAGQVAPLEASGGASEWLATATAWVTLWRDRVAAVTGARPGPAADRDPYAIAHHAARRASLRRRARQALTFSARSGAGPGLIERLRFWRRGTPQHRLGASAAVMLIRAVTEAAATGSPVVEPGARIPPGADPAALWRAALARLGVVAHPGVAAEAELELVRCWDRWVLDGQRSAEAS